MKFNFIDKMKSSTIINKTYFYLGSFLIRFISMFIRTQDNLILFVSFGGKQYNDSPKAIYEQMIIDPRFKRYEFVWAFKNPNETNVPGKAKKIKIDTITYFLTTLKARVWISNSPVERRLNYKGKNTYYFCTWHGTPIKKIGEDIAISSPIIYEKCKYDVLTAQGSFDEKVFGEAFNIVKDNIKLIGLPRNDALLNVKTNEIYNIKNKLNITLNKKVILYCPTYRDWEESFMNINVNFQKWQEVLGEEYLVLFRTHARVPNEIYTKVNSKFVYNVSDYHDLNDLMIASDLLITDYSSLSIDYAILEKPILCYTYDYEKYNKERGMYFDIREYLQGGTITEDKLLELIKNISVKENTRKVKAFKKKFVEVSGNSTKQALNIIYKNIS